MSYLKAKKVSFSKIINKKRKILRLVKGNENKIKEIFLLLNEIRPKNKSTAGAWRMKQKYKKRKEKKRKEKSIFGFPSSRGEKHTQNGKNYLPTNIKNLTQERRRM